MKIPETYLNPTNFYQVEARGRQISNRVSVSNFSSMLNSIIVDQTVSTKEDVDQKASDTSCDCDNAKKCKCASDKETEEVSEAKKTGIAACMECPNRTNGQCDLWNDKDESGAFNLFSANLHNNVAQVGVTQLSDLQTQLDIIAKASTDYNYTNVYTYVNKKKFGILMPD
ncbi:MAG: hypothetical protein RR413_05785 [Christensenellaceae bacterium]